MSRTYRNTNGESKRLKDSSRHYITYDRHDGRRQKVDKEDSVSSEDALRMRNGKSIYTKGVPRYFRKLYSSWYKKGNKSFLVNLVKYGSDSIHSERYNLKFKKNAGYNYFWCEKRH